MSLTTSIGVVGPSHWIYMASVMADRLARILKAKRVEAHDMPAGIHEDVQKFFRLVRQGAGNALADNPPASINAYVIASDAIRVVSPSLPKSRQKRGDYFEHYADFIRGLRRPHQLKADELKKARDLRKFFLHIKQEGESEAYTNAFHSDEQPSGFPLF